MNKSDYELKMEKPIQVKGHMCYMFKDKQGKKKIVRADKLVYTTFVDTKLDAMDDSWDLEHIDGNIKNCAVDNLRLK